MYYFEYVHKILFIANSLTNQSFDNSILVLHEMQYFNGHLACTDQMLYQHAYLLGVYTHEHV